MSLTVRGWGVGIGGLLWCAAALAVGQRDLWWPGLFLVFLPAASCLLLSPNLGRIRLSRRVSPDRIAVDETAQVEVHLDGTGSAGLARVRDQLPAGLGEAPWFNLGVRQRQIVYQVRPAWRGRYRIGPLELSVVDGLGLARTQRSIRTESELLVTPRVEPLTDLRAASGVGLATDTSLLRTGLSSSDDVLVREYNQGDDVRRVHWRSTAHAGQLMVRREERAWDPSATILIDNRARAYSTRLHDERLEWAVSAAASIAVHLLSTGFDLRIVRADGEVLAPHRIGAERESIVLEHLADLVPDRTPTLSGALTACDRGAEGQLLIALLGRVDADDAAALAEMSRRGRACWAFLLGSSAQLDYSQADAIRRSGWRCAIARHTSTVAAAWQELGRETIR